MQINSSLNYKMLGEGPPLVILHGLFGMLDNWQTLGRHWAEHFTVYLVDQRNHGKSPHYPEMNYQLMSADLQQWMDELGLEKINLLGHSMGGKTAMQVAVDVPERVEKLIVVDIAPKTYPAGHELIFEGFKAVQLEQVRDRQEADEQLSSVIEERGVRQFLLKNLSRNTDGSYRWKVNLAAIEKNYPQIISNSLGPYDEFSGATLFIKGGNSPRYIEPDDLPSILRSFPQARLEVVADAGHWVHAEKPILLFNLVLQFLQADA